MQIDQLRRRLDLTVLMLVIEPAGPDGNVTFGRHPVRARPVAPIQARNIRVSRREIPAVRRGPARLAGDPVIVPDPANIRAGVAEEHCSGLQVTHDLPRVRPIVVGAVVDLAAFVGAAVVAVATVRTVEEDLENRAIAGQQLAQLIAVVDEVLGAAVILVIAIPRRQIDAESYARAVDRCEEPASRAQTFDAAATAASSDARSQSPSCRSPLMKNVGVPLTPLLRPLSTSSFILAR